MAFKIEIEEDKCIGCGACVAACDECFEMDGSKAKVKKGQVDDSKKAEEAASGCPVSCIKVTEIK